MESDAAIPPDVLNFIEQAEQQNMPSDPIVPQEKRSHHAAATPRPRGRPRARKPRVTAEPPPGVEQVDHPGIVQASESPKSEIDLMTEGLATLYGTVGTLWMFANEFDGFTVINNSENMAKSVVAACRPYPQAWKILGMVVQGNVWSVLILAHLGPALAIMANHGMINRKVAGAFRQAMPPEQPPTDTRAPGPYTYPGAEMTQGDMTEQQQQELAQYIAMMAAQQGQATDQEIAAMFAPSPVDYGDAGNNGAVGMDSVSGLGDQSTAVARAAFSAAQIDSIRQESLRKTQEMAQNGQTNGL